MAITKWSIPVIEFSALFYNEAFDGSARLGIQMNRSAL
jgi:hypothetical protein